MQKDSQRGFDHTFINTNGPCLAKRQKKEKIEVKKKDKLLIKLVIKKENRRFNAIEC